jgi:hypothetical protein
MAKAHMAKHSPARDEGAPIPKDEIDPALVKLGRTRLRIGIVTALGVAALCAYLVVRLGPDRRFGGQSTRPVAVTAADIVSGAVDDDAFVEITGEPLAAHAIRSVIHRGDAGLRVVPVRGTADQVWLAIDGDDWAPPAADGHYTGRLRKLDALKLADSVRAYAAENPRPVIATAAAARAALAGAPLETADGSTLRPAPTDRVAFDVRQPARAVVIVAFNERHPTLASWIESFAAASFPAKPIAAKPSDESLGQARFEVPLPVAAATEQLAAAKLWAARVEPIVDRRQTTWGELAGVLPDHVDFVGVFARHAIPDAAWVVVATDRPEHYWYVIWITVALALIGLLFAWALVLAVRRDLFAHV